MKKHIATYRLNRDTTARKALFNGLMMSLVEKEEIITTHAKASAVKPIFEKLLTKARVGSVHARRQVQSILQSPTLVKKIVDDLAVRYAGVSGGYTRVIPVGTRRGDRAQMVKLSLTKKIIKKSVSVGARRDAPETVEAKHASPAKKISVGARRDAPEIVGARRDAPIAPKQKGSRGGDR